VKEYIYREGQVLVVSEQGNAEGRRLQWLVHDQLGTPRMVFDTSGKLHDDPATTNVVEGVRRHDYLPFGEENVYNAAGGSRTAANGYVADGVRQQFTGHERDAETGLDFMQARYYASGQGRFTSVDEPFADQYASNPQSWNLYSYVRNNPLNLIDPLGSAAQDPKKKDCLDDGACFNPESGLYELPGEPTGGIPYVVNIIEFYDPFLEKVFINQLVAEITFTEKRDALVDAAMNGIPGGKFAAFVFKSRRIIKFAELSRKIQKLKRGGTVYVDTVEEARELLEHMPELRPATLS
jgi:RHS repeat-associated protein